MIKPAIFCFSRWCFISLFLTCFIGTSFAQLDINHSLQEGRRNLANGDYVEAIRRLNDVIKIRPDQHLAWYLRGISKLQLGDNFGAESDFSTTIQLHPGFSEAYYYRGITKVEKQNYREALKDLDESIALNPLSADYYAGRGYVKLIINDTSGALCDLDTAIRIDSKHYKAYLYRSLVEMSQKKYPEALVDCDKAIQMNPFDLDVRIERGRIKLLNNDPEGAMEDLQFVLKKDSLNVLAYYLQAVNYHQKKEYNNALASYDKVISINPINALCFFNRAVLKSEIKSYKEALTDYSEVIRINPQNILAYYNRGIVRFIIKDYKGAVQDFSKAIELYPGLTDAYLNRSSARIYLNDQAGASEDKNKADLLMKKTSALTDSNDSVTREKLMEFKSDFTSIDFETGKIQYKDYQISTIPVYSIVIIPPENNTKAINFLLAIDQLNDKSKIDLQVELNNTKHNISNETIEKSITKLDSLIKYEPENCDYHFLKSILFNQAQNYNNAMDAINLSIKNCPSNYLLFFMKGNLQFQTGEILNSFGAQDELMLAVDNSNPSSGVVNDDYYKQSIANYTTSILLNPGFSYAYFNRAYTEGLINDIPGALNDYSRCLAVDNNFSAAYYNRGLIFIYLKDYKNGCNDISKAGELGIKEAYRVLYKYCD